MSAKQPTRALVLVRRGCALGFTAGAETVCARYMAGSRAWRVWCATDMLPAGSPLDERTRQIATKAEAAAYASSLIDAETTARLAWW